MNKKLSTTLKLVVGIGILVFLISKIGISEALTVLRGANIVLLFAALPLFILHFVFNAIGIKVLTDVFRRLSFGKLFKYNFYSWAIGNLLPSKLGELSLVYFLKKDEIAVADGMAVSVVDKFISLILFGLVSFVGIFFIFPRSLAYSLFISLFALSVLFLVVTFLLLNKKLMKFIPRKVRPYFDSFRDSLYSFVTKNKKETRNNFIITMIKWGFATLYFYVVFIALGVRVPFLLVLVINMVVSLISLIPISINGLGVRQAVGVYLFSSVGIPAAMSLNMYLITLFFNYLIATLVFVYMIKEGIKIERHN